MDVKNPNRIVREIGKYLSNDAIVTTDVGQNQVWIAQSMKFKSGQRAFFPEDMEQWGTHCQQQLAVLLLPEIRFIVSMEMADFK